MRQIKFLGVILTFFLYFHNVDLQAQLLWEITHQQLKKTSYLYGTIHVADQRVFQFQDSLLDKFDEVDGFAGEMIFDSSMGMMMETVSFMMMPNDTTLADLLPEEKYLRVERLMQEQFGFMTNYMLKVKPILVATMLTEQRHRKEKIISNGMILDLYFQQLAKEKNKKLIGLETFEEQAEAFDGIPLKKQADLLYQQIASPEPTEDSYDKLLTLYLSQDLDSLHHYTLSQMDVSMNEKLLISRNIKMANRAHKIMQRQSLFIAVGAAHLPGKKGVIQILRDLGYTVKPVRDKK